MAEEVKAALLEIQQSVGKYPLKNITKKYKELTDRCFNLQEPDRQECLKAFIEVVTTEHSSQTLSRHVFSDFCDNICKLDNGDLEPICLFALTSMQRRLVSFEEEDCIIREHLSRIYEKAGEWKKSADMLASSCSETWQRTCTKEALLTRYLEVTKLYIKIFDIDAAEEWANRASQLQYSVKDDNLKVQFYLWYAEVIYHRGKFLDASQRFIELSQMKELQVNVQLQALEKALNCTVLAPAGPVRSELLKTLFKNERCQDLRGYTVLKNVCLGRILKADELKEFSKQLIPDHNGLCADGTTVLARAVTEHNILSASKLYTSMRFRELGDLADVPCRTAEKVASKMIGEGRLEATIDQVDEIVHFEQMERLPVWDGHIHEVCDEVNNIVENIKKLHPDWAEEKMKEIMSTTNKTF